MVGTSAKTLFNALPPARRMFEASSPSRLSLELAASSKFNSMWSFGRISLDGGALDPGLHCIAVPWCTLYCRCHSRAGTRASTATPPSFGLRSRQHRHRDFTARSVVSAAAVSITPPSTATRPETGRE